jgi:hypothetical protein
VTARPVIVLEVRSDLPPQRALIHDNGVSCRLQQIPQMGNAFG